MFDYVYPNQNPNHKPNITLNLNLTLYHNLSQTLTLTQTITLTMTISMQKIIKLFGTLKAKVTAPAVSAAPAAKTLKFYLWFRLMPRLWLCVRVSLVLVTAHLPIGLATVTLNRPPVIPLVMSIESLALYSSRVQALQGN